MLEQSNTQDIMRQSIQAESNDQLKNDYINLKKKYDELSNQYSDNQYKFSLV